MRIQAHTPLQTRFDLFHIKCPMSGCWLWTGYAFKRDYGQITYRGETKLAHRVSWELHVGPIPKGLHVLHRCDVPPCVNPHHLFLGTHLENMADMVRKCRYVVGARNGRAKLTEGDIVSIRTDPRSERAIAADYGVGHAQIGVIKRGLNWRHVA